MRVIVTGGAGFIGSHLCDRLIQRGGQVQCVDNLQLGQFRNIKHLIHQPAFVFHELDIAVPGVLDTLCRQISFDAVFHMAANSDMRAGGTDLDLDLQCNFMTTLEVLRAIREHSIERLFFASSSAVFGEASFALSESSGPLQPVSFYGASKLAAEGHISVLTQMFGKRAVVLRFPNVCRRPADYPNSVIRAGTAAGLVMFRSLATTRRSSESLAGRAAIPRPKPSGKLFVASRSNGF